MFKKFKFYDTNLNDKLTNNIYIASLNNYKWYTKIIIVIFIMTIYV